MIAQLSKISSLEKVIAFASSRRYRNREKSLAEIGKELGVALLLEGTVRQQGQQVRVTAQLISAEEQGQLWAESYDGELSDIFAVQSRIAEQISSALRVELSPEQRANIERRPTDNLVAYDYYLRGREFYFRFNKEANENAIELFRQALEEDPEFARARAFLAFAYTSLGSIYGAGSSWLDTAIQEAERALFLDPDLARAHAALAAAYTGKGWMSKALEESKVAIELSPNSEVGYVQLGRVYTATGSIDQAYLQFRKALAINPLHAHNHWLIGYLYLGLSEYEKAEQWFNQALDLQPDDTIARLFLWVAYMSQGRLQEAAEASQRMLSLSPDDPKSNLAAGYSFMSAGDLSKAEEHLRKAYELAPELLFGEFRYTTHLGGLLWVMGKQDEAKELAAQSHALNMADLEAGNQSFPPLTDTATLHANAAEGDIDEALRWLRKAVDAGYLGLASPAWTILRSEPQFQQMKAEVDARVVEMRNRMRELEGEWE